MNWKRQIIPPPLRWCNTACWVCLYLSFKLAFIVKTLLKTIIFQKNSLQAQFVQCKNAIFSIHTLKLREGKDLIWSPIWASFCTWGLWKIQLAESVIDENRCEDMEMKSKKWIPHFRKNQQSDKEGYFVQSKFNIKNKVKDQFFRLNDQLIDFLVKYLNQPLIFNLY